MTVDEGGAVDSGPKSAHVGEPPEREVDVLRRVMALIRERLPTDWSLSVTESAAGDQGADATVELTGPDQMRAVLLVEAKRSVVMRDLAALLEQVRSYIDHLPGPAVPLVAARYLAPSVRARLEERGVSYADATGNLRVALDRPALFLHDAGADHDPWRGPGRPRGTLKGPPAARVVRALVDFAPPLSVPELIHRSGASTGATYRVVEFLEREALIGRNSRGPIETVHWRRIIERWSEDYGFQRSNAVGAYLHPRGLSTMVGNLAASPELCYAITGSLAAQPFAPYAPPRLAMIYVEDTEQVVERLGLRAVDTGANTLLATGDFSVVFDRPVEVDGLRYVAPSQTAVDLLTGPGRSPAEARALLDWMETHEHDWRR